MPHLLLDNKTYFIISERPTVCTKKLWVWFEPITNIPVIMDVDIPVIFFPRVFLSFGSTFTGTCFCIYTCLKYTYNQGMT